MDPSVHISIHFPDGPNRVQMQLINNLGNEKTAFDISAHSGKSNLNHRQSIREQKKNLLTENNNFNVD